MNYLKELFLKPDLSLVDLTMLIIVVNVGSALFQQPWAFLSSLVVWVCWLVFVKEHLDVIGRKAYAKRMEG